ncbi:DUF4286 family protein [Cryobacterium sp. Y50]|uniref:DUF4286 family protein n=1 Tax=Cryobacterium sp. Y50 TaxID=2048286 RepID=UPI000CE2EB05|nr:DUF4286 family protein [Cryobacterium sp. Y50]
MTAGMLFSQMHPPVGEESDFRDWYESEHIPVRLDVPGFANAVRYEQHGDGPRYLAVYFLDDMAALDTAEYGRIKQEPSARTAHMLENVTGFTRYTADLISDTGETDPRAAGVLFVVAFEVPVSEEGDFEAWYQGEHVPLLMKVPGWQRIRRYKTRPGAEGRPWTHFALHEIQDLATLDAPERAAARDTPLRDELASRPWFDSGRWNYFPIHYAFSTSKEHS